ncbi:MAG: DUF169 domain-containing protein [Deltaproteobacteria bacterium]|nr:DUF169 domain-containing protein [Deltaproteobacteria bacterium]
MDWREADRRLNEHLRLQTFPVALRLEESLEGLPQVYGELAGRAGPMPVCQAVAVARRYGWRVVLTRDEMTCPLGAISLGFVSPRPEHLQGCAEVPAWVRTPEARARILANLPKFEPGRYRYVVATPLARADFEPQIVVAYGNPAQIVRLVQSVIYLTGEPVVSNALGAVGCGTYITKAIQTGECQMVVSGAGDRIFGLTQDDEMSFTIPVARLPAVLDGLGETARHGVRYPTPSYLRFHPELPPSYQSFLKELPPADGREDP